MKFFYWFRVVVKVLIPLMFFVIANTADVFTANGLAGAMTIFTIFYYVLIWQKVGEKTEK